MRVSYGVVWREDGTAQEGRLSVLPDSVVLTSLEDEGAVLRELPFDELIAVSLLTEPDGERQLALNAYDDTVVEIESVADEWIIRDLVDKLLAHALRTRDIPLRFLVSCEPAGATDRTWHPGLGLS